jgi:hypothetical protein
MVEVVENFATARGSCRMTCRGVPMARRSSTIECANPLCRAADPTLNIVAGSPRTSVAAVNSRMRVS